MIKYKEKWGSEAKINADDQQSVGVATGYV
jgi:hypothetical protein